MAWSDNVILRQIQRLEYDKIREARRQMNKPQYMKWIQYPGDIEITIHTLRKYKELFSNAISRGIEYEFKNVPRIYTLPQILHIIESEIIYRSLADGG